MKGGKKIKHIAIFASGGGSNAEKIIQYFSSNPLIIIALIVCNNPGAGVIDVASRHQIETRLVDRENFFRSDTVAGWMKEKKIDLIVLAGFLWKLPPTLVAAYPNRILNIHPALLPKYGGRGMYGHHVHEAVIAAHEKQSGITIHLVDEKYDHGKHLLQVSCPVSADDTPEILAARVLQLEHAHFARAIESYLSTLD